MFCARIQEKQTKLWHTVFYESELKLKQLYVKICCNLPSHGCRVYRVKQLLNERNTNKTVSRPSSLFVKIPQIRFVLLTERNVYRDWSERFRKQKLHRGLAANGFHVRKFQILVHLWPTYF